MKADERIAASLAKKFLEHGHAYPLPVDCMNLARALLDTVRELEAARAVVEAVRALDAFSPFPRGGYIGGQTVQSQSAFELARAVARALTAYNAATGGDTP